jgi:hypothetical protein
MYIYQDNIETSHKTLKYIIIGLIIYLFSKYVFLIHPYKSLYLGLITSITFGILDILYPTIIIKK